MKKVGNKNLKIIAATSMAIFSLLTTFTAAFAWFTAIRDEQTESDNFTVTNKNTSITQIELYRYLGETDVVGGTKYFGFETTPYSTINVSGQTATIKAGDPDSIQLDMFTLDDPHHPIFMLFKLNGGFKEKISAKTSYPFIAQAKPGGNLDASHIVASYKTSTNANSLESKLAGASDGEIFEVTNDENQNGTYLDYEDNEHSITTRYSFNEAENKFDLIWVDLAMHNNPLSSAICTYYFELNDRIAPSTKNLYLYTDGERDNSTTSRSCIAIDQSECVSDSTEDGYNMSSFAQFTGDNLSKFEQEIDFYNGDVTGLGYIGIVLDYNPDALQYLFTYYLGNEYLNEGLTFQCDWETEI